MLLNIANSLIAWYRNSWRNSEEIRTVVAVAITHISPILQNVIRREVLYPNKQ